MSKYTLFNEMITSFAKDVVKPLAKQVDAEEMFPQENVAHMGKLGIMGIIVPTQYGGAGGDYHMYINAVEELSKVCATTGVILSAHTSLCVAPILDFGNDYHKSTYLPKLASGEWLGAFGLTEPNAGTDASNQQTTAVDMGDHWLLNGSKIFITNAGYAHVFIIIAVTGRTDRGPIMSAFVVERDHEGFSVGKHEEKMGIKGSSTCELIMTNCKVPKENLIGKLGDGFKIALKTLDGGRVGIAAQALGIAEGALDLTVGYVKERKQFRKPLSALQNTQFTIADMATQISAAKLLVERATEAKQTKSKQLSMFAAQAKLFAAETAMSVTTKCVQLHGGYGYTREYEVERMMRDAKITEIYEGTSEVQKMVISANILK